jgi:outer membrane protein assembly factor BamB
MLWDFQSTRRLPITPLYHDGILYLGDDAGFIYAVDAESGLGRWSVSTAGRITGTPTLVDRILYAPNDDFVSLDAVRGTLLLQVQSDRRQVSGLAVVDGMVIATGLRIPTGFVQAMNPVTAIEQWRVDLPAIVIGPPQLAGDRLVVATSGGELLAIMTGTGRVAWRASFPGAIHYAPAVGTDTVFLLSTLRAGTVVTAVDRMTGIERWRASLPGSPQLSPVIAGRLIVVATGDTIIALDAQTGATAWNHHQATSVSTLTAGTIGEVLVGTRDGSVEGLSTGDGTERWHWRSRHPLPVTGLVRTRGALYVVTGSHLIALAPPAV